MPHLSLVTLGVADLNRSTAFYEALGWERSPASVRGTVTFFHGAPVLALFGQGDLAADARLPVPEGRVPGRSALAMNVPSAAEVDRRIAEAEAAGAAISKRPELTEWGGYAAYFLDPDQHLWEVAHNPFFTLLPDGRVTLPSDG